jgi:chromate transporter
VAARTWARVGLNSFGGPAGQIAVMHRVLVEEKRWIDEERFLHALNFCMLLPGPEAQQLATYIGWLLNGVRGGLMAGTLFVLPGFVAILGLSILDVTLHDTVLLRGLLFGLKPAVLAIVLEAVLRIGRRALTDRLRLVLAAAAFAALFFLNVPFPVVVAAAAAIGFVAVRPGDASTRGTDQGAAAPRPAVRRAFLTAGAGLGLWLGPLAVLALSPWRDSIFLPLGCLFAKAAVVTFGGAYAVLAYIAQQAVEVHGWLRPGEMIDGLGMAETTPGPLIMVLQFVGFVAAWRQPGVLRPMTAAILASIWTVWLTFVPSILFILVGAPWIERLRGQRRLQGALQAITAAVVGVILNLSLWFGLHTLFGVVEEIRRPGLRLLVPRLASLDPATFLLALVAGFLVFRLRAGMGVTILTCVGAGILWVILRG